MQTNYSLIYYLLYFPSILYKLDFKLSYSIDTNIYLKFFKVKNTKIIV